MKHYCIIGGSGFIGSHLVQALLKKNQKITVVGRKQIPLRVLPKNVQYVGGGNNKKLFEAIGGADEIICLAYSTVPATSIDHPISDLLENIPPYIRLFEIASKLPIAKLVLVSSGGAVYGKTTKSLISESHPTNPISPYGITKLAIEKYALMYHELKKLPIICVRPSNVFGEGQIPFSKQGFISTAIASILNDKEITIFGKKGTIRDYIYINDLVMGILSVLDKGKLGQTYNVGSGIGRSNMDVLKEIFPLAKSAGMKPKVGHILARSFDVPTNVLDSRRLTNDTGWRTKISFEEGIANTWKWFISHRGRWT